MEKKIVIFTNTSWNIYNFRLKLAYSLKNNGYIVIFVAPYDEYSKLLNKDFDIYNIHMNNKGVNPFEDFRTIIDLYKVCKKIKPDLLLTFTVKPNIYGNLICSILNIKSINNITGLGTVFIKENFITIVVKQLYKLLLNHANVIFFQNNDDLMLFIKNKLVDLKKTDVLPGSGIDTEKFKPLPHISSSMFKFLLISRVLWDKGIGEYIKAARIVSSKYKNIQFQLLGELGVNNKTAVPENKIYEWDRIGIIKYLGVTDDVRCYIKNVNCVVLPSYREGTPRSLLESASMGKPLITTNAIGCKEVVEDNYNGYLCEVKNGNDLAEKMIKMINLSEDLRMKMGENSRKKMINEFDESIVISKYLNSIRTIFN